MNKIVRSGMVVLLLLLFGGVAGVGVALAAPEGTPVLPDGLVCFTTSPDPTAVDESPTGEPVPTEEATEDPVEVLAVDETALPPGTESPDPTEPATNEPKETSPPESSDASDSNVACVLGEKLSDTAEAIDDSGMLPPTGFVKSALPWGLAFLGTGLLALLVSRRPRGNHC